MPLCEISGLELAAVRDGRRLAPGSWKAAPLSLWMKVVLPGICRVPTAIPARVNVVMRFMTGIGVMAGLLVVSRLAGLRLAVMGYVILGLS